MLAIVLARKNIREFDQTVSLYIYEYGKLEVLAKGIKKIVSKNSANLEVLSLVEVEVIHGKDIDYLGRVQPVKFFKNIYFDLDKIYLASYITKMVDSHILVGERDEKIFDLIADFLEFLNSAEKLNSLNLVSGFIFKLWHRLGFGELEFDLDWVNTAWADINSFKSVKIDNSKIYDLACRFVENSAGIRLAKFIENDRIIG